MSPNAFADPLDGVDVPPGLDLDLDALVARRALDPHTLDQLVERILDPDRHAGSHRPAAATQHLPQRHALLLRVQIPHRHLERRFRHQVPANARQRGKHLPGVRERLSNHHRREKPGDHVPRGLRGLAAVERVVLGDALGPAVGAVTADGHQQEFAIVGPAEAGLEMVNQRQAKQTKFDAVDGHERGRMRALFVEAGLSSATTGSRSPTRSRDDDARLGEIIARRRGLPGSEAGRYTPRTLEFRHIAIEGPIGVGKSAFAERLAARLDATLILEDPDNPFLADFYSDRPGAALQSQLFYLLGRHRQQSSLRQSDLFSQTTICDYLFDRDKMYAYLNLDDNELFIYQRLFDLLARDVSTPDLVIYLQAPPDVLVRRLRDRAKDSEEDLLPARCRVPPGAERSLPALLLPLRRQPPARRRDVGIRIRADRRDRRRPDPPGGRDEQGHALLRAAGVTCSTLASAAWRGSRKAASQSRRRPTSRARFPKASG